MSDSNLPDWQLRFSYFYVSNKILLRKILVVFLILLNCLFWGYSIYGFSLWAIDYQRLDQQTKGLLFSSAEVLPILEAISPKPLQFSSIDSFSSGDDRFDLVGEASNPNPDWLAHFDYAFVSDNASTTFYSAFALPGQIKTLLALGQKISNVKLEVKNIKWTKITNYPEIQNNRERFIITNDEFLPATEVGNPSRLKFSLKNESAFSYWEAGIVVFLYSGGDIRGGNIVSVNYLSIPQFKSGSTRELEINWVRPLPAIDGFEIIPEINYLNDSNIMPPAAF